MAAGAVSVTVTVGVGAAVSVAAGAGGGVLVAVGGSIPVVTALERSRPSRPSGASTLASPQSVGNRSAKLTGVSSRLPGLSPLR